MLRALYDWTLSLAARKTAELWLGLIAFIESSVFLIPADVLFLPMGLARPILDFYGKLAEFEQLRLCTGEDTIMLLLVTSGLAHLPPIKVVTILAGVVRVSFVFFLVSCLIARGLRFFALGWALRRYGEPIRHFIENRLGLIAAGAALVVIVLYFAARYLGTSGSLFQC